MKRAAQRWMVAQIAGLGLAAAATVASAADVQVTDADRTYKNYTRESATVRQDEIRLEVRGLMEQNEGNTRLDLLGFPVTRLPGLSRGVDTLSGGIIDVLASYGFAKNAEIGFLIPSYIQSLQPNVGGPKINNGDVGDLMLYGKFQRPVAEHFTVGAGLELTTPNGPVNKGFGTGELGLNPVISTRYQQGPFGIGANVGFNFYTNDFPDVVNYGVEVFLRGTESFTLRTEIIGRVFDSSFQNSSGRFHDLEILPGIDFKWAEGLTIRLTGMSQGTDTAMDWGIGAGMVTSFMVPRPAVPEAPPPPPPPPVAAAPVKEKIVLRGVRFDFDKATIRADAMPVLDQAAETLKEHGAIMVTVEGHTDNVGSEEYNEKLSVRRATAVRDYLAEHGVAASRMTVVGKGESNPVASNDTEDGRAQNRRVELLVAP